MLLLGGWGACDININLPDDPEEPTDPEPLACQVHSDCLDGQLCINGLCHDDEDPPQPPPDTCLDDSECAPDQRCELVETCLPCNAPEGADCALDCFIEGRCVGDEPPPPPPEECQSDDDCGEGFHCEYRDYVDNCGTNGDCAAPEYLGGVCVPDDNFWGCLDVACPAGYECVEYYECYDYGTDCGDANRPDGDVDCGGTGECFPVVDCVPVDPYPTECYSDEDCGPEAYCQLNLYTGQIPECDGDADCEGLWAPAGICVPYYPDQGCQTDSDCGGGMICQVQEYCTGVCPGYDPATGQEPIDCNVECFTEGFCTYPTEPDHCADLPVAFCEEVQGCHLEEIWAGCAQPVDDNGDPTGQIAPCPEEVILICVSDAPNPTGECFDDSDCGPGFRCDLFEACPAIACDPNDPNCVEYPCFVEGQCVPDYGQGSCEGACGGGSFDGSCFCDDVCLQYGDCCSDFLDVCEDIVRPCQADTDCEGGLVCRDETGFCGYPDPAFCESDADCEQGQVCEQIDWGNEPIYDDNGQPVDPSILPPGFCVDLPQPPPEPLPEPVRCESDADCAQGEVCALMDVCLMYCEVNDPNCGCTGELGGICTPGN